MKAVIVNTKDVRRWRMFEAHGLIDALTGFERMLARPDRGYPRDGTGQAR